MPAREAPRSAVEPNRRLKWPPPDARHPGLAPGAPARSCSRAAHRGQPRRRRPAEPATAAAHAAAPPRGGRRRPPGPGVRPAGPGLRGPPRGHAAHDPQRVGRAVGRGQDEVRKKRLHGLTDAQFKAMSAGDQSVWWAHAIRHVRPGLTGTDPASVKAAWDELSASQGRGPQARDGQGHRARSSTRCPPTSGTPGGRRRSAGCGRRLALGDPLLIDTGPRAATADAANLQEAGGRTPTRCSTQSRPAPKTTNLTQGVRCLQRSPRREQVREGPHSG